MSVVATEPPIKPFAPVKKIRIFQPTRRRVSIRFITALSFFAIEDRSLALIVTAFASSIYIASRRDRTVELPDGYTQDVYS
jgi:hypothetical protein